jgi:antitoxin CptB
MPDIDYPHLHWRSHRGMLELDELLLPFIEACFNQLSDNERQIYAALLQEPDPMLYAWLIKQSETVKEPYAELIQQIRSFHQLSP